MMLVLVLVVLLLLLLAAAANGSLTFFDSRGFIESLCGAHVSQSLKLALKVVGSEPSITLSTRVPLGRSDCSAYATPFASPPRFSLGVAPFPTHTKISEPVSTMKTSSVTSIERSSLSAATSVVFSSPDASLNLISFVIPPPIALVRAGTLSMAPPTTAVFDAGAAFPDAGIATHNRLFDVGAAFAEAGVAARNRLRRTQLCSWVSRASVSRTWRRSRRTALLSSTTNMPTTKRMQYQMRRTVCHDLTGSSAPSSACLSVAGVAAEKVGAELVVVKVEAMAATNVVWKVVRKVVREASNSISGRKGAGGSEGGEGGEVAFTTVSIAYCTHTEQL